MIKKGNLLKSNQLHNEQNQQKFNIKATRPSPTCWEELKLVLDNELPQNKKASQISNIKNTSMHNKSNSSNSNNPAQNNNNNFKKNNEKNRSSKKKDTILYIPHRLSNINASYNLFGYFNGPIAFNDDKIKSKNKNIDLIIEVSFEFHLENEYKVILALDENKLCHFSSPLEQDQSQAKNQNQNVYYQMQWNPYYSNMISHSNSYPKVQFVPIVQGYAIYPQQNQQYQQQVLNIPQVNQVPSTNAMSTANIQENDEK